MSHHIPSVSWQQARQILHEQGLEIAHHVKTESLPLLATIDHYLADDVYSMMPVPHYSSSAMDGYACLLYTSCQLDEHIRLGGAVQQVRA